MRVLDNVRQVTIQPICDLGVSASLRERNPLPSLL